MELPLREQGTLLTVVRGCDLTPKFPLDSPERKLVAWLRGSFMVPADPREVDVENGSFMSHKFPIGFKPSCVGHYPQHWVMHIVHAIEIIGYRHPITAWRVPAYNLYLEFCRSLHITAERYTEMIERLSEDRIAKGEVVL